MKSFKVTKYTVDLFTLLAFKTDHNHGLPLSHTELYCILCE